MKIKLKFLFVLLFASFFVRAQESPTLSLSIPYQNSVLYNRYLVNPAFSFVGETDRNISLYSRSQWISFNDSPKVYQLNYSGKFSDRTGFGIGLYSQNLGVITSFGGIGNAAYFVPFNEEMGLTLGANLVYYSSGVDMSKVDVENSDPYLMSLDKRSLVSFHPGFNFNYKRIDVGMYAENLINYDFKTSQFVKQYSETTLSGHLMYTYFLPKEGATLRAMARFRNNQTFGFNTGISLLANFPTWGWVQSGYDTYYGLALGFGIHISKKLSVGYVYEKTTNFGMQNLGGTHEFNLVFTLPSELSKNTIPDTGMQNMSEPKLEKQEKSTKVQSPKEKISDIENVTETVSPKLVPQDIIDQPKETVSENMNVKQPPVSVINPTLEMMEEEDIQKVFSKNTEFKRKSPDKIEQITVPTINSGYYIIAGVFQKSQNVYRLVTTLKKDGIDAMSFTNPENNYQYVYLRYYNTRKEALAAYYSNVDNTYFDTIWILKIDKK